MLQCIYDDDFVARPVRVKNGFSVKQTIEIE